MTRVEQAKLYLAKAKENPQDNELYIADLELSIPMMELSQPHQIEIKEGFVA